MVGRFEGLLGFSGDSEPWREEPERKSISSSLKSSSNEMAIPLRDLCVCVRWVGVDLDTGRNSEVM